MVVACVLCRSPGDLDYDANRPPRAIMTHEAPFDGEITSATAFEETLAHMIRSAHRNGVDVEGGWVCRNGDTTPDYEAVIVELRKSGSDDA